MYIGKNIKYLRCKNGYSQEELSKHLGYKSYTTITKWESGVSEPTLKMTNQIAAFFNISVNDLCYKKLWSFNDKSNSKDKSDLIEKKDEVIPLNKKDEKDIAKKLDETLGQLESSDGLMFDGEVLDEETKELLKISLENALRTAKVTAKKKFTPKKYKND